MYLSASAMCIEKLIDAGQMTRTAEIDDSIVRYYEQAGDYLLVYLQNRLVLLLSYVYLPCRNARPPNRVEWYLNVSTPSNCESED